MKTMTMVLIAGGLGVGYYLYKQSKPQTTTVLGGGTDGTQSVTINVDGNMSASDITAMQTAWNAAMNANDTTAAQTVITNMTNAKHTVAAASLQTILTNAQNAANTAAAAQGYSAGAMSLRRVQMLPQIARLPYHPDRLVHIHRLAMIGRI